MQQMKYAFEMRLSEMAPLKHIDQSRNLVADNPFNNDVITKYRKIIRKLVELEEAFIKKGDLPEGLHPMVAGFPTGFFAYLFDPAKVKHYIEENDVSPIKLPTKELLRYVDQQQLDPIHRFEEYDKDAPIVILESPLFNQPFCIGGNIKIVEARRFKKSSLKVFYFLTDEYLHFMFDDLSKAMHMFHMDLQRISDSTIPLKFDDLYISKTDKYITL